MNKNVACCDHLFALFFLVNQLLLHLSPLSNHIHRHGHIHTPSRGPILQIPIGTTRPPAKVSQVEMEEETPQKTPDKGTLVCDGPLPIYTKMEPSFVSAELKLTITEIWIRLPQLPTEFYNRAILEQVGNMVGNLLKDTCTSSTLGGGGGEDLCPSSIRHPCHHKSHHRHPQPMKGKGFSTGNVGELAIHYTTVHPPPKPTKPTAQPSIPHNHNYWYCSWRRVFMENGPFQVEQKGTHKGNRLPNPAGVTQEPPTIQVRRYNGVTGTFLNLTATIIGGGSPKSHEHLNLRKQLGPLGQVTENQQDLNL